MTLVELMVVIVILAVLLGVAAGMLAGAGKSSSIQAAKYEVVALLAAARSEAARSGGAQVVFDLREQTVTPVLRQTVGLWHGEWIEDDVLIPGAFGRDMRVVGNVGIEVEGRLGGAIRLMDEKDSADCIAPAGTFDFTEGLALECWIKQYPFIDTVDDPADPNFGAFLPYDKRQTIVSKGGSYELYLDEDRYVVGFVSGAYPAEEVRSTERVLPDRWYHLELVWDGYLRLLVNDVDQEQFLSDPAPSGGGYLATNPAPGAPLVLGDQAGSSFVGLVDELRVSAIRLGERTVKLPDHIIMERAGDAPPAPGSAEAMPVVINFDRDGRLSPRFHQGPVLINFLRMEQGRVVQSLPLLVRTMGVVE